jgi:hypothetical protein
MRSRRRKKGLRWREEDEIDVNIISSKDGREGGRIHPVESMS